MVQSLESRPQDLSERASLIQTLVAELVTDISLLSQELRSSAPAAAPRVAQPSEPAEPAGEPGTAPRFPAEVPKARKYYVVIVANACGLVGIHTDYGSYAESVRDLSQVWNGRNKIPFATGTFSQSFVDFRDAWTFWIENHPTIDPEIYR